MRAVPALLATLAMDRAAGSCAEPTPDLSGEFEPYFKTGEVDVKILRAPSREPWIRAEFVIAAPAETVYAVIADFRDYEAIFSREVSEANIIQHSPEVTVLHLVWSMPFPFSERDAVVAYRAERCTDGVFRVSWRHSERSGNIATKGVRIAKVEGETVIHADGDNRCRVTYTYYGDLGGHLAKWMKEHAWRREPVKYHEAVQRALSPSPYPDPAGGSKR